MHFESGAVKSTADSESLINPIHLKLFHDDLVDLSTQIPTVVHSPAKTTQIPGILILEGNQTYGRTANNKRLFYKCVPDNSHLPAFLIPFQPDVNFSKTLKNRFVIFKFDNWTQKHPQGILTENLGDASDLTAFYEYQLFCRNIHTSIADFNSAAKKLVKSAPDALTCIIQNPAFFANWSPENITQPRIFSIDPAGTTDVDDAFSIVQDSPFLATVRVYIANVYVWLETLNLWNYIGERISTIYLPDFKRPMIPHILSEFACSLTANGRDHVAFCMEVQINVETATILSNSVRFYNQTIQVAKNHVYGSQELAKDADYRLLHRFSKLLDPTVVDSHDVVAFWMIQMNSICGDMLHKRGKGIFRQTTWDADEDSATPAEYVSGSLGEHALNRTIIGPLICGDLPNTLSLNTKRLIAGWKRTSGQYVGVSPDGNTAKHCAMGKESYAHLTSPIRRIVDIVNQLTFQLEFGMISHISPAAHEFLCKWSNELPLINQTMKSIRKVQIDCDVLHKCTVHPEWMQHKHRGVIFDRTLKPDDGLYGYMVHLVDLDILGRVVSPEKYVNYQTMEFKIFVFEDAEKLRRKIRLGIVSK